MKTRWINKNQIFVLKVLHDIHLDEVTNVAKLPNYSNRRRNDSRFYAIDFDFVEIKG